MKDKRLLYRVIIKLMAVAGIIALLAVFLNAAFDGGPETGEVEVVSDEIISLKLALVSTTEPTIMVWNNQRIGVIKRDGMQQMGLIQASSKSPQASSESVDQHPWRSIDVSYFVYIDKGDSGHCPLFFEGKAFKDTCSGNRFDMAGKQIGGARTLSVPPHHYAQAGQLVIGRWTP